MINRSAVDRRLEVQSPGPSPLSDSVVIFGESQMQLRVECWCHSWWCVWRSTHRKLESHVSDAKLWS